VSVEKNKIVHKYYALFDDNHKIIAKVKFEDAPRNITEWYRQQAKAHMLNPQLKGQIKSLEIGIVEFTILETVTLQK